MEMTADKDGKITVSREEMADFQARHEFFTDLVGGWKWSGVSLWLCALEACQIGWIISMGGHACGVVVVESLRAARAEEDAV